MAAAVYHFFAAKPILQRVGLGCIGPGFGVRPQGRSRGHRAGAEAEQRSGVRRQRLARRRWRNGVLIPCALSLSKGLSVLLLGWQRTNRSALRRRWMLRAAQRRSP